MVPRDSSKPEIYDLYFEIRANQDVAQFDVSVADSLRVEVVDAEAYVSHDDRAFSFTQPFFLLSLEVLVQRVVGPTLEDEVDLNHSMLPSLVSRTRVLV